MFKVNNKEMLYWQSYYHIKIFFIFINITIIIILLSISDKAFRPGATLTKSQAALQCILSDWARFQKSTVVRFKKHDCQKTSSVIPSALPTKIFV